MDKKCRDCEATNLMSLADDGRSTGKKGWVNEQTINYITKYVFKIDSKHIDFKGRVFASAGIGKAYLDDELNRYRHRYQGEKTNTTYTDSQGYTCGLPKYYRDRLYTEEERRKLWSIQLDKNDGKVIIDGVEYEEVKGNQFKNMIFATFTFSEEEYSKLAKEVRGDIIKQYGEVQGDIDNRSEERRVGKECRL